MEAIKIVLLVALACFMQGQAVPVKKTNDLKPQLYITVTAAAYTGKEETQVAQLELDATISGQPKSKHVDIRSITDMINKKMSSIQAQQYDENTVSFGSIKNSLPLAVSATIEAEVVINQSEKDPKIYGLDLDFKLWAQKKHNETLIKF
uniref:Lipid-binding serum glycoprotein N-terminal domain-containing protein n=1 Tax=Homalodisca liturata TaxID=320908 RepID=A0A1B6J095_9HEMI